MNIFRFRIQVLSNHLHIPTPLSASLEASTCLHHSPPELSEPIRFDTRKMRKLLDGHNWEERDMLYQLMIQSELFGSKEKGSGVSVGPDYNQSMKQQREMTMKRMLYLSGHGAFDGFLTENGPQNDLRIAYTTEIAAQFDLACGFMIAVQFLLW
ncbi:Peroxisomal acyl-CoA oxidase [Heracleum sosnowskyi]|uniref:Peroxisomal acyl-CoA oxidase n=1 Tax=Heracleum sosnowskyi TaxID=360622 RepID=A0AAD8IWE6_9APIA|nr:Peroxisomal acyl-CoA oxidase [Heracleum sosnowskyi]